MTTSFRLTSAVDHRNGATEEQGLFGLNKDRQLYTALFCARLTDKMTGELLTLQRLGFIPTPPK